MYRHFQNFADSSLVPAKMRQIWAIFQAIMVQLLAQVIATDSQMVVMIIPTEYQVYPEILEGTIEDFYVMRQSSCRVAEHGLRVVYTGDSHPNQAGAFTLWPRPVEG